MKQSLKVSVIIPAYNAEKYISESLQSVLAQTWRNLQVIIINDGSTDNTAAIIKNAVDPRLEYYYQENQGQCAANNAGLREATGDYIKFFDADDLMNPEHIEEQVKRLNGSTTAIASCAWGKFTNDDPATAAFVPETVWKDMLPLKWLKAALTQKRDMMGACLWLIPAKLLAIAGGWDERLSVNNDFEFSIRLLLQADEVLFAPGARIYYRSGLAGSLSKRNSLASMEAVFLSTQLGCRYLLEADSNKEMKLICANRYQDWIYQVYPDHPELVAKMQAEVTQLGGSKIKPQGGRGFHILKRLVGWKNTKKIQRAIYRLGYLKLLRH